jgi:hypothetical protein
VCANTNVAQCLAARGFLAGAATFITAQIAAGFHHGLERLRFLFVIAGETETNPSIDFFDLTVELFAEIHRQTATTCHFTHLLS